MINRFIRLAYLDETCKLLTKEQKNAILHDIEIINFGRMKIILSVLIIIELLFIGLVDIPNLTNSSINPAWGDKKYFILHMLLLLLGFAGIITINLLRKTEEGKERIICGIVNQGITMLLLILISILNGLDQVTLGQGGSVVIANLLVCSAVILIRFPLSLFVYSVPFLTFVGGILICQKNLALLYSNLINGTIFFIAALIISKVVYESQYIQMSKNLLLEEVNDKLNYLSNHDPLTGLSNRRNFEIQAKQRFGHLKQGEEVPMLVLMDIDYFKKINDQFGHPVGDIVIKAVSNILLANIKDTDLATRWGGEEFLILLHPSSMAEAYKLAEKTRIAIANHTIAADQLNFHITASFGVAPLTGAFQDSFDTSYKLADQALYRAKEQGRNQVMAAIDDACN